MNKKKEKKKGKKGKNRRRRFKKEELRTKGRKKEGFPYHFGGEIQ